MCVLLREFLTASFSAQADSLRAGLGYKLSLQRAKSLIFTLRRNHDENGLTLVNDAKKSFSLRFRRKFVEVGDGGHVVMIDTQDDVALFQILRCRTLRGDSGDHDATNVRRDAELLPKRRRQVLYRDSAQWTFSGRFFGSRGVRKVAWALFDGNFLFERLAISKNFESYRSTRRCGSRKSRKIA